MHIQAADLEQIAIHIFEAAGSSPTEAATVARRLVEANLTGHDSHGIIRIHQYVSMVKAGQQRPNQSVEVVHEADSVAVIDGRWGYGQIVAGQAMRIAIGKAGQHGIAMVTLRHASHVGRLADWAKMATDAGMMAILFCNGIGARLLVVPHGGRDGRGSTNPMAIGVPVEGGEPILLDFATSAIAEGKARVAHHKGVAVPEHALIDHEGHPTRNPAVLYENPMGALLPFGGAGSGHKGGGLWLMCDLLAGALSGGGASHPIGDEPRFSNNMTAIVIAPGLFAESDLAQEIRRYVDFVKSSRPAEAEGEVLLPGEPEQRHKAERLAHGIPVPDATWSELMEAAKEVGLDPASLVQLAGIKAA